MMHTKQFYWMHRFHHRFNKYVPPSAANAVTIYEFTAAYSGPFVIGCLIFGSDRVALQVAIGLNYLLSALVHTPWMQSLSKAVFPWFLVSAHDHNEHHRLLNKHYASPTWNVDRILAWLFVEPAEQKTQRYSATPRTTA